MRKKVLSYLFLMLFSFSFSGCTAIDFGNSTNKIYLKMKKELIAKGFEEVTTNTFQKTNIETYTKLGTFEHYDVEYFYFDTLTYERRTHIDALRISETLKYNLKTDISNGNSIFFEEDSNKWEDYWEYYYDYNTSVSNCTSKIYSHGCTESNIIDLKGKVIGLVGLKEEEIEKIK